MSILDEAVDKLGKARRFVVSRDGERALKFIGWELGVGAVGWGLQKDDPPDKWISGTTVRLYLTTDGRWISQVERRLADRFGTRKKRLEAAVRESAEEAFEWLTRGAVLEPATLQAWNAARSLLPAIPADLPVAGPEEVQVLLRRDRPLPALE